jgi:hypothetical protein
VLVKAGNSSRPRNLNPVSDLINSELPAVALLVRKSRALLSYSMRFPVHASTEVH